MMWRKEHCWSIFLLSTQQTFFFWFIATDSENLSGIDIFTNTFNTSDVSNDSNLDRFTITFPSSNEWHTSYNTNQECSKILHKPSRLRNTYPIYVRHTLISVRLTFCKCLCPTNSQGEIICITLPFLEQNRHLTCIGTSLLLIIISPLTFVTVGYLFF